jgi:hypothetical protein
MLGASGGARSELDDGLSHARRAAWPRVCLRAAGWACVLIFVAYAIVVGRSTRHQNADSLIPIFVSLESWSLFYWGQDRFGMLTPLLALPVRDSFINLLFQNFLTVGFLLSGMIAACRRLNVPHAPLCGVVFAVLLLALEQHLIVLLLLTTNQSYGPALGCFGLAMYFFGRSSKLSLLAALTLSLIGAWANGGVAIFMTIFGAALLFVPEARRFAIPLLTCALLSVVGHQALQPLAPERQHVFNIPAVTDMPRLVWTFWTSAYGMLGHRGVLGTVGLWGLAIAAAVARREGRWQLVCACLGALVAAAFVYGGVMAIFLGGMDRHFMAAFPIFVAAPIIIVVINVPPIAEWVPASMRPATRYLTLPLVLACLLAQTGLRWPDTVRRELIANLGMGRHTPFYANRVAVVTGNYWEVWPIVFAMNLVHERQTGLRPVLPVVFRSAPLQSRLGSVLPPGARVAIIPPGELGSWTAPGLPPLRVDATYDGYALATVIGH